MAKLTTAYNMVAEALRGRILSGSFAPGEQLPPERELCGQYEASRITIRRAMQLLEDEALITRRQGSGTFVSATHSQKIRILNADFYGSVSQHAPKLVRSVLVMEWTQATSEVARILGTIPGDRVLYARRMDALDNAPVAADDVYLLGRYAERLDRADLSELDFLDAWQRTQNVDFDYASQDVEAIPAEPPFSSLLKVNDGVPLLKETNVVYLTSNTPAGLFVSWYRHEYFRMSSTVRLAKRNPEMTR